MFVTAWKFELNIDQIAKIIKSSKNHVEQILKDNNVYK